MVISRVSMSTWVSSKVANSSIVSDHFLL